MKRLWLIVLSILVTMVIMSACSSENEQAAGEGETKEITVWTWPNNDQTFEDITIPLFEEAHPDIKVKVQAFGQGDYANKLSSSLIAGEGPDVAMVEINDVINFKAMEAFEDLSKDPYNAGDLEEDYNTYFWDYVTDEDGYIFALPKNSGPAAMFYNKPIFEEAGLPTEPEEVNELLKTWDDYLQVAEELSIPGEQWMLGVPTEVSNTIMQQGETSYFSESGELQIDNEHFMYVYDTVSKLHEIEAFSPYEQYAPEWNSAIQQGNIATFLFGNWFGKYLKNNTDGAEGEWGVTYAPAYQGKSAFNQGGDFIGIVKDSDNKEASWEFIQFVTQDMENLKGMYEKDELYPTYLEALNESWMNNENEFFGGQVTNDVFKTVSDEMAAPYVTENDPVASEGLSNMLTNITLGEMSIEEALEQATEEINARVE